MMEKTAIAHKSNVKRSNLKQPTNSHVRRRRSSQTSCGGCGACRKITSSTNASASLMLKSLDPGKKVCATRFLQRTYGNQYVQRLIQTKRDSPCLERCGSRAIQMKASGCCGGCANHSKEEESPIQTKLTIGKPGYVYEQEADRVADTVMKMPESQVQRLPKGKEEEEIQVQAKPVAGQITPLAQKQPIEEEEEDLQAKKASDSTTGVTPSLETSLNAQQAGGQQLPKADRSFMENRFGSDFSGVRVHTDSNAVQMNRALNAQAFTYGKDIYFGAGRYSPGTSSGKRLLAHELTHVIQQQGTLRKTIMRAINCNAKYDRCIEDYDDRYEACKDRGLFICTAACLLRAPWGGAGKAACIAACLAVYNTACRADRRSGHRCCRLAKAKCKRTGSWPSWYWWWNC